jgi:hypothetical protein
VSEESNIPQHEIDEINRKLAQFIGDSSYGFDGSDIDDELPSFANPQEYDFLDDSFNDIDFSQFKGDVKANLHKINKKIISRPATKKFIKKKNLKKPLTKEFQVRKRATVIGGRGGRNFEKVIVPRDRTVIIEGVNSFLLADTKETDQYKQIGYYKGKKLQQLVLIFNNNTPNDFNLELFNPSMPLDYLFSTSQNLNNMIQVAGGQVSYTDVLFNILANPIFIPNATVTISGPKTTEQKSVSFQITNKFINGVTKVDPLNIALQIDNMQVEGNNISFDFYDTMNKPYVPDGMEIITYNILAGNTVTVAFFYEQKSIKKLFFPEARKQAKMF